MALFEECFLYICTDVSPEESSYVKSFTSSQHTHTHTHSHRAKSDLQWSDVMHKKIQKVWSFRLCVAESTALLPWSKILIMCNWHAHIHTLNSSGIMHKRWIMPRVFSSCMPYKFFHVLIFFALKFCVAHHFSICFSNCVSRFMENPWRVNLVCNEWKLARCSWIAYGSRKTVEF